ARLARDLHHRLDPGVATFRAGAHSTLRAQRPAVRLWARGTDAAPQLMEDAKMKRTTTTTSTSTSDLFAHINDKLPELGNVGLDMERLRADLEASAVAAAAHPAPPAASRPNPGLSTRMQLHTNSDLATRAAVGLITPEERAWSGRLGHPELQQST